MDGTLCLREWDYKLCKLVGVLTKSECLEFEQGFEKNLFYQKMGGKECPICYSFVMKDNET